jgi:diguanylate cyclase (GGDEF)-like protein
MGRSTIIRKGNKHSGVARSNKSNHPAAAKKHFPPHLAFSREMAKLSNKTNALFLEYYIRFKILSTLSEQMDVERTLAVVKKLIRKNFPVAQYSLMLIGESGDALVLRSHFGLPRKESENGRYALDENIYGEALKRGQPIYVPDLQEAPARYEYHSGNHAKKGAFLALPLIAKNGRVVGVTNLFRRRPHSFSAKEIDLLRKIAGQLGQVLDTIAVYHQTRALSITDELTKVFNRRYFNQRFEREMQRAQRYHRVLALIMLDIDHFKIFNDTHGHLWGDAVLKQVAQTLDDNLRKADILARFGGEEFVILLPEIDKKHGRQVAEKLRRAIENTSFPKAGTQPLGRITVSLGLAAFPEDAEGAGDLIHHADQGLYLAKSRGRNQVGVYQEPKEKISRPANSKTAALVKAPS